MGDYYPGSAKFFLGFLGSFGIPTDDLEQAGTTFNSIRGSYGKKVEGSETCKIAISTIYYSKLVDFIVDAEVVGKS